MNSRVLLGLLCVAATAAGAWVSVPMPFTDVPTTLQTVVVCFAGLTLGPWLGMVAMAVYLGLGAVGVPVFAGGASGLDVLRGPTAGYLFGFIAAQPAIAVGHFLFSGDKKIIQNWFAAFLGHVVILGVGVVWLQHSRDLAWYHALNVGVWPFVVGAVLKSLVAGIAGWWVQATQ